jgi:nucleolar protein 53
MENKNKKLGEKINKNKSKHGKKNWRKNIDISQLEKTNNRLNQEKIEEKNLESMKNEELFHIDVNPSSSSKFIGKKVDRKKTPFKRSRYEERKIKRTVIKPSNENKFFKENENVDLWGEESTSKKNKISYPSLNQKLHYPKVPLPHPGQSYNPSHNDLTNLVDKVIEHTKRIKQHPEQKTETTEIEEKKFESGDEEEEDVKDFKVSNNPPVDDYTQRKTRTERNKSLRKKLNKIKERVNIVAKQNRIKLSNAKGLKRVEKERKMKEKEMEEKIKEQKKKEKEKQNLLKLGVVEE